MSIFHSNLFIKKDLAKCARSFFLPNKITITSYLLDRLRHGSPYHRDL